MKKNALILIIALISIPSFANENEVETKSKINKVTVYLNGAQVYRRGFFNFKKGINTIIFKDVSRYVNQKTIQVKGKGDYIILDVKKDYKYLKPDKTIKPISNKILRQIAKKQDSLTEISYETTEISNKFTFLRTEKNFLMQNKVFKKDTLPTLIASLSYLRKQLYDINKEEINLKRRNRKLTVLRNGLNKRIRDLRNYNATKNPKVNNQPSHRVLVTIQAKKKGSGRMTINYLVSNASWSPSYDIRVQNINSPVDLTMKAMVYQNSGEDWNNVKLTLSTNNPYKNKVKPELTTWFLNYYNPNLGYYNNRDKYKRKQRASAQKAESLNEISIISDNLKDMPSAVGSVNYTVKQANIVNVEYKISIPYTIKADNKAHLVAVSKEKIKAKYFHYLVPKYDTEAYLVAKLVDWEELDLLPAKANLFYDGTYVGETRINPTMNDTLLISLGNDRNVRIKRTKDKDRTKNKIFTNRKKNTISYNLEIKNMGNKALNIIVEDHIPVTKDQTIEITLENKSRAKFNNKTGLMIWDFKLKPKGRKKINYTYTVEYDKSKTLHVSNL